MTKTGLIVKAHIQETSGWRNTEIPHGPDNLDLGAPQTT